jgi:ABC-type Fe3+/spermidine/putrescine transport system ATPase subunit
MIINSGKIDAIDTPENIYRSPKNIETAKLFGDVTSLKIDNERLHIRPENIKIVEKSPYNIEVKDSFYLGEKYRISANLGGDIFNLYHNTNLNQGENLYIDFNKEDILDF